VKLTGPSPPNNSTHHVSLILAIPFNLSHSRGEKRVQVTICLDESRDWQAASATERGGAPGCECFKAFAGRDRIGWSTLRPVELLQVPCPGARGTGLARAIARQ
jgi:hypothetical protein